MNKYWTMGNNFPVEVLKLPHNCPHLTASEVMLKTLQARLQHEPWTSRSSSWFLKRQRSQRSNCQHPMDHWKSKRVPKIIYFCFIDYAKAFDCVDHNKLWKILKEMGIPDHLTCLLRNLYAGQETAARTGHGTTDCFQIGKGVRQGCILSPCLFNLYAESIVRNAGLEEAQDGIKMPGEISITSGMQMTPPLFQKVKGN